MSATAAASNPQDPFQQEVDQLRNQIGVLKTSGIWTATNPPKLTGVYGTALQSLLAGEYLIRAFTRLHIASEANRTTQYTILTLVRQYKIKLEAKPKQGAR